MALRVAVDALWILGMALGANGCSSDDGEGPRCGPDDVVVSAIVDGDTVDLTGGERIRYLLVDAPEITHSSTGQSDCYGDEAQALNRSLVEGKGVRLEYDVECRDVYNRLLAYVWLGDRMINVVLVERGYARVLQVPPNGEGYAERFLQLEAAAREQGAGLWGACP